MTIPINDIRGAVARGWCAEVNQEKEMDPALAEAISQEVAKLISEQWPRNQGYGRAGYMPSATHRDDTERGDGYK